MLFILISWKNSLTYILFIFISIDFSSISCNKIKNLYITVITIRFYVLSNLAFLRGFYLNKHTNITDCKTSCNIEFSFARNFFIINIILNFFHYYILLLTITYLFIGIKIEFLLNLTNRFYLLKNEQGLNIWAY